MRRRDFLKNTLSTAFSPLAFGSVSLQGRGPGQTSPVIFRDVTKESKIIFKHINAATGQKFLMETMVPGCAFFDFDGDGFLDIYFVNGAVLPGFRPKGEIRNALYRNNRDGTFMDVTERAGVSGQGYGMGVVAGDYNNDGNVDLFVTNFGSSILYRNNGDGTFTDVTAAARVNNPGWGTSAAFFDYDKDGFLDLFVCNYVDYSLANNIFCGHYPDFHSYCSPQNFQGTACVLYHNNGDGTFTDVSELSQIGASKGKSLGVVTADFDGDGYQDIYVANDEMPNFLFLNNRDGTFSEIGALSGAAYSANGNAQSGMGVATADYDGDGRLDIVVTNLSFEGYSLFHNEGNRLFMDTTFPAGVGAPSLLLTGWGVGFIDFDNDGKEDIFSANGHVLDNVEIKSPTLRYLEPTLLLKNLGDRFVDVTAEHGRALNVPRPSRGVAFGDFDNDGDIDILICNCNDAPTLLRNDGGNRNHWLTLKVVGKRSNRDGIGVKVRLSAGQKTQSKEVTGGGSYLSSNDRRLHFGLGTAGLADEIEILWPSSKSQTLQNVKVDRILTLEEP